MEIFTRTSSRLLYFKGLKADNTNFKKPEFYSIYILFTLSPLKIIRARDYMKGNEVLKKTSVPSSTFTLDPKTWACSGILINKRVTKSRSKPVPSRVFTTKA